MPIIRYTKIRNSQLSERQQNWIEEAWKKYKLKGFKPVYRVMNHPNNSSWLRYRYDPEFAALLEYGYVTNCGVYTCLTQRSLIYLLER